MEEQMISKITAVKNWEEIMPTDKHFWATIKATSPRVIIPMPIFKESLKLNLQILAIMPQPTILEPSATTTKARQNSRNFTSVISKEVFKPMLTKKIGAKII